MSDVTKEELDALQKDINAAKSAIAVDAVNKATTDVAAKVRADVEKEFELKKALEDQARKSAELEAALSREREEQRKKLEELQAKMNDLVSSRAPVQNEDPFKAHTGTVANMTEAVAERVEENSAETFWEEKLGPGVFSQIKAQANRR